MPGEMNEGELFLLFGVSFVVLISVSFFFVLLMWDVTNDAPLLDYWESPPARKATVYLGTMDDERKFLRHGSFSRNFLLDGNLVKTIEIAVEDRIKGAIIKSYHDEFPGVSYLARGSEEWKVFLFPELSNWRVAGLTCQERSLFVTLVYNETPKLSVGCWA